MTGPTCPYCNHENERDDIGNPDDYETECSECEKTFMYSVEYEPIFASRKADCLNGGEHEYRPMIGAPAEYFANRLRCWVCRCESITIGGQS